MVIDWPWENIGGAFAICKFIEFDTLAGEQNEKPKKKKKKTKKSMARVSI